MSRTRISTQQPYAPFPYITSHGLSDENPAQWLTKCDESLPALVASLIDGMRSVDRELERLQDWQYVASALDCDQAVHDYLDARERRLLGKRAAPMLRRVWAIGDEDELREVQQAELDGPRRRAVIACIDARLRRLSEEGDEAAVEPDPSETEGPEDDDTASVPAFAWEDVPASQAREIAAAKDTPALRSLLARAREADAPEHIVEAIDGVLTDRQAASAATSLTNATGEVTST